MLKNILGVAIGYAVFAISSVLFFKLTKQPPHADASTMFMIATLAFGITVSVVGGYITRLIAANAKANYALAILIFLLALMSMIFSSGAHWTQWFAMLFFAPCSVLGGYLKLKQNNA